MRETTGKELLLEADKGNTFAVYFYTPTCGTCKVASRMMEAVELLLPGVAFYSCNINLAPQLAAQWQIRSVPCAGYVQNGHPVELRYRMGGSDELYRYYQERTKSPSAF